MQAEQMLSFGPYQLDKRNQQLWRGKQEVRVTKKAFAVLCYLVDHAGELVTKEEFFAQLWPKTIVGDAALTVTIAEVRRVLGDKARSPRFIEVVPRRGYRFIGQVQGSKFQEPSFPPPSFLVGRETELAHLRGWFEKALSGHRQLIFVTGEVGIGKTTVVEAFLAGLRRQGTGNGEPDRQRAKIDTDPRPPLPDPWLSWGQCIEQYGAGEAYLPILEALDRLCRGPEGKRLITLIERHAPTWLVQLPALLSVARLKALQQKVQGVTKERMLRELAEALEAITLERSVVLVLEDLHWSDTATIDFLNALARRREPARLFIVGTYRPVEVIVREHRLKEVKQELQLHQQCEELPLGFLSMEAVRAYLYGRFPDSTLPDQLATIVHERTDGNPLFMVTVVDELVRQGVLGQGASPDALRAELEQIAVGIPETLQQLIEWQVEGLSQQDQQVVEVGSVAGMEFSAAAVAAGAEQTIEAVEACCESLARRGQLLRSEGPEEWPDGTIATRYSFLHALYQEVTYKRLTVARRVRVHLQIGARLEAAYGEKASAIVAELAVHFERGRGYDKAVQYLQQAAQNALQRSAYVEATHHCGRGIELLKALPDTPERAQRELSLQVSLGRALITTKGYAAPEVEQAFSQALGLCRRIGDTPQLVPTLGGIFLFSFNRGQLQVAQEIAEQFSRLAQNSQDPIRLITASQMSGVIAFRTGELSQSRDRLEQALTYYDPQIHDPRITGLMQDPKMDTLSYLGWLLWHMGYPEQALQKQSEALAWAEELSHPHSVAFALSTFASLHLFRREWPAAQERAEEVIRLATQQKFPNWVGGGMIRLGSALVEQGQVEEGISQLRQGIAAYRMTGAEVTVPYFLTLLGETYGKAGQVEEALTVVAEALALVEKNNERVWEAELYRLKGELTLQQGAGG
jgi:predicted ATPase/DNA-binding winged helix-turn-helix (wHTH) protein